MSFVETLGRSLATLYLVVGHLAAAHFIAARLVASPAFLLRWLATFLVGMYLATLGFHVLATAGLFTAPAAVVAMTLYLGVVFGPRWARELARVDRARDCEAVRRLVARFRRSPGRGWIAAFAVVSIPTVLRPWVVPPLGWDSYVYHAFKAGLWVHDGGLAFMRGISSWACFRNYPAAGEVFTAWGMLPFHDDTLAMAPETVQWIGVILAAIAVARELGLREPYATATAGAFATLPPLRLLIGSGYIEPGLCLTLVGGLAFALRYLNRGEAGALALAAASLGVAAGFKITVLPLAALLLAVVGVRALWRRDRALLAAALLFLGAAAPWYVYNAIDTGLPFTPYPIKVLGVWLGHDVASTGITALGKAVKPFVWDTEWKALTLTFAAGSKQPEALGIAATAPLLVFLFAWPWAVVRRSRRTLAVVTALLFFAVNMVTLFGRDAAPLRLLWPESASRFWLPAYAVALPISAAWCARWPRAGRVYLSILLGMSFFHLLRAVHQGHSRYDDRAMLMVAAVLLVGGTVLRMIPAGWWRRVAAVAGVAALLAAFDGYRADRRYEAFWTSTAIHFTPRTWLELARVIDQPDTPHRVAVTGGPMAWSESWFGYGLFGTRLQNDLFYVPITRGGEIVEDLDQLAKVGDRDAWVARLRERRVEYVVSLQPKTIEIGWIEKLPRVFEKVTVVEGGRGVWRVKPVTAPGAVALPARR